MIPSHSQRSDERVVATPPSAVVFDLGKVLLEFDFGIAARQLALRSRLEAASLRRVLDQSPLLHRYESGQLSSKQFFDEVATVSGYEGSFEEFSAAFSDIFAEISPMIALQQELRRQSWKTYIFSNTNELAAQFIARAYPFFSGFDGYIFSFEHGTMKPDPRLYEVVERITQRRGSELLYLDDRAENINVAAQRQWQTIWHREVGETISEVRARCGLDGPGVAR